MAGACLALAALWLLRARSPVARLAVWLCVLEAFADLLNATVMRIREEAFASVQAITWLILTFYVPALWTSLGLLVWQLVVRRHDELGGPEMQREQQPL